MPPLLVVEVERRYYDIGASQTGLEGQQLYDSRVDAKINVK